jgi:hypothetical protein
VRFGFKFVFAVAVVAVFGALPGGCGAKLSHERFTHLSSPGPSDRSQLKGDLEQQGTLRPRLFNESLPALAGNVLCISCSGAESELLLQDSLSSRAAFLTFPLYQRPPPA